MKKINLISGLLILTIIGSCQYDPFAHKYTTKKPKEKELDGRYIFEKQTVNLEIKEFIDTLTNRQVNPIIEINSDGTYRVINLPVFESYSSNFTGIISNSGKWNITSVGSIGDYSGKLKKHWGIYLSDLPFEIQYVGLMNKKPPYKLVFGFGDPDSGEVMIFIKE